MSSPYKTVAFQTLGCKLNFAESSAIAQDFYKHGYANVSIDDIADIYVINTCSVTDNADKKARKAIRKALRKSPNAQIAVIGCYAQLNPKEIASIPGVSIVAGTEEKFNLVERFESLQVDNPPIIFNSQIDSVNKFHPAHSLYDRTRSFLKVQDGCDYTCSFCTIPLARGRSRSGSIQETIIKAEEIASSNIKEIVLTGVNIGDFGRNNGEKFLDLIKALDEVNDIERYRISSIEPNLLSDEIINFTLNSQKFLPHFHIPLQSGSNKILKNMRRRYNIQLYADRIKKIKMLNSSTCIGLDIIVGFPGESEDDFHKTVNFIENVDVSYLHIFSYSERLHTDAKLIKDKVSDPEIMKRSKILHKLGLKKKKHFYEQNIGSIKKLLIESYQEGFVSGHSENYIPIKLKGCKKDINQIINTKLIALEYDKVIGERQI